VSRRVVLGIDAAWTAGNPSGVALVAGHGRRWRALAVAPSYASFVALAGGQRLDWRARPAGGAADCGALVDAATRLAGARPDVIALDIPLATRAVLARRPADTAIARAFGGRGCAVHSPLPDRPGPIAGALHDGFAAHGFALATARTPAGTRAAMLEVFPHAALLSLVGADYRLPYKTSRSSKYWPALSLAARRRALLVQWRRILTALSARIDGIALPLPRAGTIAGLKRYEDAMDALVCAWVGIEFLAGRVRAYGDDTAAIWT
jgi:predicted RNase H-like nuclease